MSAVNKTRETTGVEVEDGTSDGAKAAAGELSADARLACRDRVTVRATGARGTCCQSHKS